MTEQHESVLRKLLSILGGYNTNIRLDEKNVDDTIEECMRSGYTMILMGSDSSWLSDFDMHCLATIARQANMVIVEDPEYDVWLGYEKNILSRPYFTTRRFEKSWTVYR